MNTAKMYTICYVEPFKMNYKYSNSIIIHYTIKSLICTFKMFRNRFSPSFAPHSHRSCKWLKNQRYMHDKLSVIIQLYQTDTTDEIKLLNNFGPVPELERFIA